MHLYAAMLQVKLLCFHCVYSITQGISRNNSQQKHWHEYYLRSSNNNRSLGYTWTGQVTPEDMIPQTAVHDNRQW